MASQRAQIERAFFAAEPSQEAALAYALRTPQAAAPTKASWQAAHADATSSDPETRSQWAYAGLKSAELLSERLATEDDPFILGELIESCTHTGLLTSEHFEHAIAVGGRALMHATHCLTAPREVREAFREQLYGWRNNPTRSPYQPVNAVYGAALTARYDPEAIPVLITDAPSAVLVELGPIMRYIDSLTISRTRRAELVRATATRLTTSAHDVVLAEALIRFASLLATHDRRRAAAALPTSDLMALPARAFGRDSDGRYEVSPLIVALLPSDTLRQVFNHVVAGSHGTPLTLAEALAVLTNATTAQQTVARRARRAAKPTTAGALTA